MRTILLLAVLLGAAFPRFACAQTNDPDAHARLTYWWLAPPTVVHDSLAAQRCWQRASFGDVLPVASKEQTEAFISKDGAVVRLFTFYQGRLAQQSFVVTPGSVDNQRIQQWFERCYALADGRRLDREFGLVLTRKDISTGTMFILEPDWNDEEAKKL